LAIYHTRGKKMKNELNQVMEKYLLEESLRVDSGSYCYELICKTLPQKISGFLDRDDLIVQGSVGKGNKTSFPWISILNRNITTSTQEGLYMVFLFKKDMSGFYLALSNGITYFEKKFGAQKYAMARQMVDYYQTQIEPRDYSFDLIDLGAKKSEIGYGYEQTTVLSFEFHKNNFEDYDIHKALKDILEKYDEIYYHMQSRSYDEVIDQVLETESEFTDLYTAIKQADDVLYEDSATLYDVKRLLVEEVPYARRSTKYKKMTAPIIRKTDYVKKAQVDAKTGLLGEKLVMLFEEARLSKLGLGDMLPEVKQVSVVSDTYGFDLESYDIDDNGNIQKIYIEVKTTSSKIDTEFYVSKNEVNKSFELNERFWIYRVYDCYASEPKFYRAQGPIEENFELDPVTYLAKFKYPRILQDSN
jgi:hypothetical protein